MKIGIISTTKGLPWAATDEVWSRCAALALAQGHEVFLTADHLVVASDKLNVLKDSGFQVCARRPFRPTRLYLLKERYASEMTPLEKFNPDVILFNGGSIFDAFHQPNLSLFCKRFPGPIVFFCHGHSEGYQIREQERLGAFLAGMAGLVFVAAENCKTLENQLATSFPQSRVIRNSPSLQLVHPLPMPGNKIARLACVARVDAFWKGHDVLLRVLAKPQWRERPWRLDIYGRGQDEEHVRKLAAHLQLQDRVLMRGHVDDIVEIWRESDLMLLPSRAESLSLAMLEAMICGRPPVTTDVGDHRHVIEDGSNGFIAEAATPYSFGKALDRAWEVRNRWSAIGQAAHCKAKELIIANPGQQLLDFLLEVGSQSLGKTNS